MNDLELVEFVKKHVAVGIAERDGKIISILAVVKDGIILWTKVADWNDASEHIKDLENQCDVLAEKLAEEVARDGCERQDEIEKLQAENERQKNANCGRQAHINGLKRENADLKSAADTLAIKAEVMYHKIRDLKARLETRGTWEGKRDPAISGPFVGQERTGIDGAPIKDADAGD